MGAIPERPDWAALAAFGIGTVLAGGNGVAIRFSNRELAPLWGAALRFILAAALLFGLIAVLRLALPRGRALRGAIFYGVLQFSGAFGLYYYALVEVHAGLGQTLLAVVPLATLLLAVAQQQEKLSLQTLAGTFIGFIGVLLVASDPLRGSVSLVSLLAVLGSIVCFGQAAVVVRGIPGVHPIVLNGVGMLTGAVVLLCASVVSEEPLARPESIATWLALAYVVVAGSVVVFLLYVFLIQRWTASRAAHVMLVIPVVTVLLSAWLDNEPIGAGLVGGGALVLAGVYVGALRRSGTSVRTHRHPNNTDHLQRSG